MKSDNEQVTGLSSKAEAAFLRAAARVIERARQTGTPVVVWREGRVEEIPCERLQATMVKRRSKPSAASSPDEPTST
jgi:DhnA family fructose-bisphosphate aldolase class Ia